MSAPSPDSPLAGPLAGLKVVEFTHMVMGPSIGVILGDLGAEVIKIEPEGGDHTRRLLGSGAGLVKLLREEPAESTFLTGGKLTMELVDFH